MRIRNQRIETFQDKRAVAHIAVLTVALIAMFAGPGILGTSGLILTALALGVTAKVVYQFVGAPEALGTSYTLAEDADECAKTARTLIRSPYLKHNPIAKAVARNLKTQARAVHDNAVAISTDELKNIDTPEDTRERVRNLQKDVDTMGKALQALRTLRDEEQRLAGDQAKKRDVDQAARSAAEETTSNLRLLNEQISDVKDARATLWN